VKTQAGTKVKDESEDESIRERTRPGPKVVDVTEEMKVEESIRKKLEKLREMDKYRDEIRKLLSVFEDRGQLGKGSKIPFEVFVSESNFNQTLDNLKKMEAALRKIDAEQKNNKEFSLKITTAYDHFPEEKPPTTISTSNLPRGTTTRSTTTRRTTTRSASN